ncbi:hypothetical protein GEU84_007185 [Fertoebacter nigrum]|uniref:Pilus assembly protein n=1 Tax=Fertoeibacter niger TaxID=2656921 RepID=A0A8X8KNL3_9RHOB|nr:hypothetical protein [Fertoeibacter niger]NUB44160.1 hypothetical protein [Fertoeibacter niger]
MIRLRVFLNAESGAVTMDWVVLTAAVVGMGLMVFAPLFTSTSGVANNVATSITTAVTN